MAVALLALDRARGLDRAAVEQELFGQRGFTGVGVRDDRKGPAPLDFFLILRHIVLLFQMIVSGRPSVREESTFFCS